MSLVKSRRKCSIIKIINIETTREVTQKDPIEAGTIVTDPN